jgi:cell division transport system permease protein
LSVPVPAVIAVRLTNATINLNPLFRRLTEAAPGTLVEDHGVWIGRLAVLARSLQACAGLTVLMVAGVAAAVIAVATRAGLSTRREAIEIVHGLGATDSFIASRFAGRAMLLASAGAAIGTIGALPILLTLAHLAAPFAGEPGAASATMSESLGSESLGSESLGPGTLGALPAPLWAALPCLPLIAAAIGYLTAHGAVRQWLRRLP